MAFNPKVSIIIPVYNGSDYLREAVDSALGQTYKDIEVIVVNDGSNDGGKTEEIAKAHGDKIRYFYKENGGVASALNLGIRNMTGDYFSWLSHDDVYYPEKIERQVRYLKKNSNRSVITYCDCEIIDKNSNVVAISRIDEKYLKNVYLTILSTAIGGCSLLIPKLCFEKAGLFNEALKTTQDNEMWLRIAVAGFSFEYLPEILLKSRDHPNQGSKTLKKYHQKEREDFYRWAIQYVGAYINSIYDEMNNVLLGKKIFKAHDELLRIKYNYYITFFKYYGFVRYILFNRLIPDSIMRMFCFPLRQVTMKPRSRLFRSSDYWERRYAKGGNSGIGSHGHLAVYKAGVINSFVRENNIQSVIEFGCGDGNQLAYYKFPNYTGLDVSNKAITNCKKRFDGDPSKRFILYEDLSRKNIESESADLTLSIDVVYHLVEDAVFLRHLHDLFYYSNRYVIIYSTNFDRVYDSPHQVDRKFTPHIEKNIEDFKLIETIINPHKGRETMSDFYVYKRMG